MHSLADEQFKKMYVKTRTVTVSILDKNKIDLISKYHK